MRYSRFHLLAPLAFGAILSTTTPVRSATPVATDAITWALRNPSPTGDTLLGVAASADAFVAAGLGGTVLRSSFGATWQEVTAPDHGAPILVTYVDGTFLIVSPDTILSSPDGWTWSAQPTPTSSDSSAAILSANATQGSRVLATTDGVYVSTNGGAWQFRSFGALGVMSSVTTVASDSDRIFVITSSGLLTSTSSASWDAASIPGMRGTPRTVDYVGGKFIATSADQIATSADGVAWSVAIAPASLRYFTKLYKSGDSWLLTTDNPDDYWVSHDDLASWTEITPGDGLHRDYVAKQTTGAWVAVGRDGSLGTSIDGVSWVRRDSGLSSTMYAITRFGGQWIAVGANSTALVSSDGLVWTNVPVSSDEPYHILDRVAVFNGRVYAASLTGVFSSADGRHWEHADAWPETTSWDFSDIPSVYHHPANPTWVGDRWMITATPGLIGSGAIFASIDGNHWTRVLTTGLTLSSVAGRAGAYVAVGAAGIVYFSADGITWAPTQTNSDAAFTKVIAANGWFFAGVAGRKPGVLYSSDGQTWQHIPNLTTTLYGAAAIDGSIWFTGQNGTIVEINTTPPAPLANLSTRSMLQADSGPVIAGFVVEGTGETPLLVRAIGDGLRQFGVTDVAENPTLQLFSNGAAIPDSGKWDGTSQQSLVQSFEALTGAFPLQSGSGDAALVCQTKPGVYTAVVNNGSSVSGEVLVEVYSPQDDANSTARLRNTSTRGFASSEHPLIGGFVIHGDRPRRVLVRGIGPGLTQFGVANAASDPELTVMSGSDTLFQNDNWFDNADPLAVADTAAEVGAFALPHNSHDAAVVCTLKPGTYTVHVSPASNTPAGEVLFEVYYVD